MSTKAQAKTQAKPPAAPAAARIPQPPVAELEHKGERPDIAAQLEGAARLGHSLGAVGVDSFAPPAIQRQEIPEEEEEELQRMPAPPGEVALQRQELPEEEEEELQMKREPAAVQRQEIPEEEEEELQMMPAPPGQVALQRQELPEEEEELMMMADGQRVGLQGGQVPPDVEVAIRRARGGGQPLEGALQEQMSASLGYDFSGVRVHTDAEADALNQQLTAQAFTTGRDIFFRQGEYNPGSDSGRELIGHELTHVVQQSTGRVRGHERGMVVRPSGDALEQEADDRGRGPQSEIRARTGQRAVARLADMLASHRTDCNSAGRRALPDQGWARASAKLACFGVKESDVMAGQERGNQGGGSVQRVRAGDFGMQQRGDTCGWYALARTLSAAGRRRGEDTDEALIRRVGRVAARRSETGHLPDPEDVRRIARALGRRGTRVQEFVSTVGLLGALERSSRPQMMGIGQPGQPMAAHWIVPEQVLRSGEVRYWDPRMASIISTWVPPLWAQSQAAAGRVEVAAIVQGIAGIGPGAGWRRYRAARRRVVRAFQRRITAGGPFRGVNLRFAHAIAKGWTRRIDVRLAGRLVEIG